MAKDLTPDAWIPGWSEDGTNITIPIASLDGLTAAEADATTGNIGKCLRAILQTCYTHQQTLATADKPVEFSFLRGTTTDDILQTTTRTLSLRANIEATGEEVVTDA
jgi:hypothetical protein